MDNMDLLKLIVFEACEDGRVDDFDKQDMLNFIEEAVKLQDKKEHDKILSANKKEILRDDDDVHDEFAIVVKVGSNRISFDFHPYRYGTINNKTVSKKSALQDLVNKCKNVGLFSFGHYGSDKRMRVLVIRLTKEYNKDMTEYEWAQTVAKVKNKCSIMSPEFKKDCDEIISKYKK